eukprot:gene1847-2022_t
MAGEEFLGPSCLYDILSSRFKENPFILKRSLYHNEEKTSHVVNNGKLMIRLQFNEIIPSCRLWCYGVVKMRDKPYHAIQRAILTVGSTINISCLVEESVFSSDCDDFFFILFLSPSTATVDTLDKWCVRLLALADESCQAMTMSADEAAEPWKELTSVIMPCHTLLIDLHAGYIAKHRKAKRPSRSAFRSFMYPGTCSTQGMKWSKTLQCRFSPVDRAPHDVKDADITCDVTIALKRGQVQSNAMEGKAGSKRPRMISNTYSYLPSPALTVANSTLSSGTDNTVMVYHCISQNQEREEEEIRYERRTQVQCLWCRETFPCSSLNTKEQESNHGHEGKRSYLHSLGNLQRHLALFHTHFNYTMGLDKEGVCHVLVTRRYRHTTSGYDSPITNTKLASYELIVSQEGKQMQEAQSTQIRKTPRPFRSSFSSVRASNIRSLLQHTYYHVATGQKMMPKEVEIYLTSASASDEQHPEINLNNYELSATNAAVEEYVDINYYERQFMKLWNAHVQTFPPHGDTLLTLVVDCFAHRFGDIMVTKGLRHTFLVHLLSLWDFGLLTAEEVYYHINTVDKIKHAKKDQIDDMDKKC